jgi:hypothetical protein
VKDHTPDSTLEPIMPEIPEGLFDLARDLWLDDCERLGGVPDQPAPARSIVGPLVIELRSVNGHLATYRYSSDSDGLIHLKRLPPASNPFIKRS